MNSRIKHFPISFFSIVMGLAGYTIATQKLELIFKLSKISNYIAYTNFTLFLIISGLYFIKTTVFFQEVKNDFIHPVRMAFVPTISIAMLLLSISFLEVNVNISKILFLIGAPLHLIFSLNTITKWIQPEKLMPTLFILIAPPAVAFVSYMKLVDNLDNFAKVLYFFALFTLILIAFQYNLFTKIKFYLSWWAYISPLSSFSIASFLMFSKTKFIFFKYSFILVFVLATVLSVIVVIKTINSIIKKEICIEEE